MINILNIFTTETGFDFLMLLAITAAKATLLVGFAVLLSLVFRRFSAAARHFIWALVLCAALLLPFLSFVKGWEISILPVSNEPSNILTAHEVQTSQLPETPKTPMVPKAPADSFDSSEQVSKVGLQMPMANNSEVEAQPIQKSSASLSTQIINFVLIVWLMGALLFSVRLLTGIISTNLLTRRSGEFENPALTGLFASLLSEMNLKNRIRLLRSERTVMPIVCGIWRPVVILPAQAETWTEERCRMVLLHELTHIARRDCLTQMLAQVACIFYWFNPFIWLAAHRLRVEREQACDEYVLSLGTKASDYAHHLLEIARSIQDQGAEVFEYSPTTTIAMAQKSQLEGRLVAILNPHHKYRRISHPVTVSLMLLIGLLFLSLVIIHPIAAKADNSQTAKIETNSGAKETTQENSLLNLFVNPASQSQKKDAHESAGKNETENDLAESLETEKENTVQNAESVNQHESLVTEQNTEQNLNQVGKDEPISDSTEIVNSGPNPFVKIEYKDGNQAQRQVQSDDFIDEMASVGYKNLTIDELIRLKAVGVTAEYVKALRALGIDNLSVKELVSLRAVGVTPKYIEEMRKAGFKDATAQELSNMRALGVTPEFIKKFRDAGFDNLTTKDLTSLSASGMTIEYMNTMNSMGFGKLSLKELTNLKFNGITPEFIRLARSRLGDDLTLKQIVALKHTGILKEKDKEE